VSPLLVAMALSVPAPGPTAAADYLIIFAGDSAPYRATKAHTFAALVRVETTPGGPARVTDLQSISWLPETMKVRALAMRPEVGRNVPLNETLEFYLRPGSHVNAWGPYLVKPEFAATFRARVATVNGHFRYKGASFLSPRDVCDCARAVEEMARPDRRFIGIFGYGAAAASSAVRTFTPSLVEPEHSHAWVAQVAGLGAYPIRWRAFGDATSSGDQMRALRRP
jgi:hypothetical protein